MVGWKLISTQTSTPWGIPLKRGMGVLVVPRGYKSDFGSPQGVPPLNVDSVSFFGAFRVMFLD